MDYRAEMQPDQWPKYRYLLLEIWHPTHPALQSVLAEERSECRAEVFAALHDHYETAFCRENQKAKDELTKDERKAIADQPQLITLCSAVLSIGMLRHDARLARTGGRMLAAELVATAMKSLVKHRVVRTRPHVIDDGDDYRMETRFDIGARYVIATGQTPITLRANVDNVANRRYWASSFDTFRPDLLQGLPRTYKASVSLDF